MIHIPLSEGGFNTIIKAGENSITCVGRFIDFDINMACRGGKQFLPDKLKVGLNAEVPVLSRFPGEMRYFHW